jgi:hypothetical protein
MAVLVDIANISAITGNKANTERSPITVQFHRSLEPRKKLLVDDQCGIRLHQHMIVYRFF